MEIIETSVFTRKVLSLLSDDEYRLLQADLLERPDLGPRIPSTGGIRKMRWAAKGHGKRGGIRCSYYWAERQDCLLMLLIYAKNEQDDLTPNQKKILRKIIQEEYP